MLDGVQTPEQLFDTCAANGWDSIAITEHGSMASVPDNYFAAKAKNIKYIPGQEIYYNDYEPMRQKLLQGQLSDLKQTDLDLHQRITRNRHLTVLAKNEVGFKNLITMTTRAWEIGFYGKPRVWFDELVKYKEGLTILSGCMNGPVSHEVNKGNIKKALDYVQKFKEAFGEDFLIEVQMPCIEEEGKDDRKIFTILHTIAARLKMRVVLTNDSHYVRREDARTQKLMMAVSQDLTVTSPELFHTNSDEQFLKTRAQLYETFKTKGYSATVTDQQFEQSCDNTLWVASRCQNYKPNLDPKIPTMEGDVEKLKQLAASELIRRGLHKSTKKYPMDNREVTHREQMKIELDRFIEKGFASYFLITRELIQFNTQNGWPVGPRGCTVPDSLVGMPGGQRRIDEIETGDTILDGFGNKQIVENKFIYDVSEELFVFELEDGSVIKITSDHKLYIVRNGQVMLLKASEIKDTDECIGIC